MIRTPFDITLWVRGGIPISTLERSRDSWKAIKASHTSEDWGVVSSGTGTSLDSALLALLDPLGSSGDENKIGEHSPSL